MNAPLADAEADEAFLRLISSDPDLFRAEFDTLISAGWGNPRVFRPSRGNRRRQCRSDKPSRTWPSRPPVSESGRPSILVIQARSPPGRTLGRTV
jgi:hypothetical protein